MQDELLSMLGARKGHFKLESGHHGDLWLDLDPLFLHPRRLEPFITELAQRLARHGIEAICGPLIGGALLGQMVAAELDVEFFYAERFAPAQSSGLFQVEYKIPASLLEQVRGKWVAVVDDAINAGSAVRATIADLRAYGAQTVALGSLIVLNDSAAQLAAANNIPLESIAQLSSGLWTPEECPLCRSGAPLITV